MHVMYSICVFFSFILFPTPHDGSTSTWDVVLATNIGYYLRCNGWPEGFVHVLVIANANIWWIFSNHRWNGHVVKVKKMCWWHSLVNVKKRCKMPLLVYENVVLHLITYECAELDKWHTGDSRSMTEVTREERTHFEWEWSWSLGRTLISIAHGKLGSKPLPVALLAFVLHSHLWMSNLMQLGQS